MKNNPIPSVFAIILAALFMTAWSAFAQSPGPLKVGVNQQTLIADLEKAIPGLMKAADIPGLSIAVIRDGKLFWTRGFGVKNVKTNEPVGEDTIFEAASLTKPFFAYLVMKFVERGEIDLNRPLIEYLPGQKIEGILGHPLDLEGFRSDWLRLVTARQVLSHSSGFPHGERGKPFPLFFEPGTKYRYSAAGYFYLQSVIEHLRGKPMAEIMEDMVLKPLRMKASSMVWQDKYETQAAVGHDAASETDGKFRKRMQAHAAASLYTTASDYAQFVMAMMNDVGLKGETIREMLKPQIEVAKDVSWGLGFGLEQTSNGPAFWQWGDYGIFRNYVVAYKEAKIGVVYLTNSNNGLSVCQDIVRKAIGGEKDLGIAYLDYDQYDSPGSLFFKAVQEKGADQAAHLFREFKKNDPAGLTEASVNRAGYRLLNGKKYQEAIAVFQLNVETYPESANACDSLAEAYLTSGNKEQAITFYNRILETVPRDKKADRAFLEGLKSNALEKLKELQKK